MNLQSNYSKKIWILISAINLNQYCNMMSLKLPFIVISKLMILQLMNKPILSILSNKLLTKM